MLTPVKRFGSGQKHLAYVGPGDCDVAEAFGVKYLSPPADTVALCGVAIRDGVLLPQSAYPYTCRACRHVASAGGDR